MWLLETLFQEDVEQTTYLVYQRYQSLCEEYKEHYSKNPFDNGTIETGDTLMNNMKEKRKKKRWEDDSISINMTHNRCKAWVTIKYLSNNPTSSTPR